MENVREEFRKELQNFSHLPYYNHAYEGRYLIYKLDNYALDWKDIITFVNIGLDHDFYTEICRITAPDAPEVLLNKYRQLPVDYIPGDLEVINPSYNTGMLLLRHNARLAFERMGGEAQREGILIKAVSTFRSFTYQKQVYYRNWLYDIPLELYQAERDKVSARAGHSEHQTGLAVDINDLEEDFAATPEGIWLAKHSYQYGYLLRYPKGKDHITGYNYEPWHFRYLGLKSAESVYHSGLTYDEYYVRYIAV